ncbi:unnamed protein product [Rotaria sordida]|uniref:Uncharacterized protein n=1 Tax=Rotaria sordida TaxID=392033 RepID=A0A819WNB8_9BILA|nr:unnamed protein product [Rotaria sordida]
MQQLSKRDLKMDLEEISKQTSVLKHEELRNDIKIKPKDAIKIPNITIQKESSSDLITDPKEPVTPTYVREQPQLEMTVSNDNIRLVPSDPNAFTPVFCQQRQAAIDNMAYRTAVNSWKAKSIDDVVKLINELSFGKSLIDRAWIVFYWVSQNVKYDFKSYFWGVFGHSSPEDVFKNRK